MGQSIDQRMNEWILRRVYGIPRRFRMGGCHHHQPELGKGERKRAIEIFELTPLSLIITGYNRNFQHRSVRLATPS